MCLFVSKDIAKLTLAFYCSMTAFLSYLSLVELVWVTLKLVTRHNRRPAVGHSQKATRDGRVVSVAFLLTASDHRMCSTSLWQCEHFSTENKASNKVRVYTLSSSNINYYAGKAGLPAIGPELILFMLVLLSLQSSWFSPDRLEECNSILTTK